MASTLDSMRRSAQVEDQPQYRQPRICMPTLRSIWRGAFQCGLYEAQDVLAPTGEVDLIDFQPQRGFRTWDLWQRRLLFRGLFPGLTSINPGLQIVQLSQDYDLFIAVCQNLWDLRYVNAISGWKERCKTSVCWLDEIWGTDISAYRHLIPGLRKFDHVFVNSESML